jgi:hypothetical protein
VPVGRAGEGPDWRGFCAAVTPRISASSPELAGGGRRQPAIQFLEACTQGQLLQLGHATTKKVVFYSGGPWGPAVGNLPSVTFPTLALLGFGRDCAKLGLLFVAATTFRTGPQCPDGAAPATWRVWEDWPMTGNDNSRKCACLTLSTSKKTIYQ